MAREIASSVAREITLARLNSGLSVRAAARLAGVSPQTQSRAELGDSSLQLATLCRVAAAGGLRVWGRAFPASAPSLRDTGQLTIAGALRNLGHPSLTFRLEVAVGDQRSVDVVCYGATEIIAIEIERLLSDFQAQYRRATEKRDALAERHQRPVRLVFAVLDTRRNRAAVHAHAPVIATALPAGTREVLGAIRTGRPLSRDGLVWVRPGVIATSATLHRRGDAGPD